MKIGIIGLGNMAKAMIAGMLTKGIVEPKDIIASRRNEVERNEFAKQFGIRVTANNLEVVEEADLILLAVKPQFYSEVLFEIKEKIQGKTLLSVAPGKTIAYLHEILGENCNIIRSMPNTPALVGEGCTAVCFENHYPQMQKRIIFEILGSFGKVHEVRENLMDVVVGVSGSSPAYVFILIEAMADGAVLKGMPRELAYEFAAQAVLGSAKMVLETKKHPGELKDMVCSPGGTTIQAVQVLEEAGFRSAIMDAVDVCVEKAKSL